MTHTILGSLITFLFHHKADIASKIAASAGYDAIKKSLNFKDLAGKVKTFFKRPEQSDQFVDQVVHKELGENEAAEAAIARIYQHVTGDQVPSGLMEAITAWLKENEQAILQTTNATFNNVNGFAIGSQHAQGNIQNIQGDMNINNG